MLSYDFSYKKNKNKNSPYSYLQGMIHSSVMGMKMFLLNCYNGEMEREFLYL